MKIPQFIIESVDGKSIMCKTEQTLFLIPKKDLITKKSLKPIRLYSTYSKAYQALELQANPKNLKIREIFVRV